MDSLAQSSGDICLVVDQEFSKIYDGRTDHPLEQAEMCTINERELVEKIGKCCCNYSEAVGEFIGLAKFTAKGAQQLVASYEALAAQYKDTTDKPFVRAKNWQQTYLCDLLEYMTQQDRVAMTPVFIKGRWREIDTVQDKTRADATVDW